MPDLPTPRDEREKSAMEAVCRRAARELGDLIHQRSHPGGWYVSGNELRNQFAAKMDELVNAAIPPVGEGMPTLAKSWALVNKRDGTFSVGFATREQAAEHHGAIRDHWRWSVVRLTIAEVYDPPAPDSWEKLARDAVEAFGNTIADGGTSCEWRALEARRAALLAGKGEGNG